jgi:HK97 family phage major capsid protein
MPEVQIVPVSSNIVELPRESTAAAAAAVAEAGTISPNDPTLSLQEFALKKQARLQLFSNELLSDSNPAIDRVVMGMLARDVALLQDSQYLEGSGSGANVTGLADLLGPDDLELGGRDERLHAGRRRLGEAAVRHLQGERPNPTAFVMHPRTLQNIALLKDAQGRYIFTDVSVWGGPQLLVPSATGSPTRVRRSADLLGYPVYLSTQISITRTQGSSQRRDEHLLRRLPPSA